MIEYFNLNSYVVNENQTLFDLIKKINLNGKGFAIPVDNYYKVKGIFTDGDIRRLLIKRINLNFRIKDFIKKKFIYFYKDAFEEKNFSRYNAKQIPILYKNRKLFGIYFNLSENEIQLDNTVFILAGGLGKRMGILTKNTPKPMLKINKKPILENIILSFKKKGFVNFIISTNYLAKKITSYFKDGSFLGVNIKYIKEKSFLGTAGSLSLCNKKKISSDVFIVNGDVYGNLDYRNMLSIHKKRKYDLTVCARFHTYNLPYGLLVERNNNNFLDEKPKLTYLINSGIYIIKKSLLNFIKKNHYLDMNQFLNFLKKLKKKIGIYTLYEPIYDIGNQKQYNEVRKILRKNSAK
jgi:dTDP-glucose pyrophosphorylase